MRKSERTGVRRITLENQCLEVDVAMAAGASPCRGEAAAARRPTSGGDVNSGARAGTAMTAQAVRFRGRSPETRQCVARRCRHFFSMCLNVFLLPSRAPRTAGRCCVGGPACFGLRRVASGCKRRRSRHLASRPCSKEGDFDYHERNPIPEVARGAALLFISRRCESSGLDLWRAAWLARHVLEGGSPYSPAAVRRLARVAWQAGAVTALGGGAEAVHPENMKNNPGCGVL
jgi:hypothetical protein